MFCIYLKMKKSIFHKQKNNWCNSCIFEVFYYFCNVREERVIIALGSNVHARRNMRTARELLLHLLPSIQFTRCIKTEPIGMSGVASYLNCLCWGTVAMSENTLLAMLKDVERQCGDVREKRAHGLVEMDVDLLLYGSKRHHEKDWEREYIIRLMEEGEINKIIRLKE